MGIQVVPILVRIFFFLKLLGSKTVISKSTSKITFPRGDLLDTLSVKVPERKFQRETNPGTKKQTVQLDGWPSWTERATISAIHRAGPVQIGGWPSWIERATGSAIRWAGPVQLGGWSSWIECMTSSATHRAGPVQFGGWPSLIERMTSSAIRRAGTIVLFLSCPQCSFPKIVSNSLLFRLDRKYHWNSTI